MGRCSSSTSIPGPTSPSPPLRPIPKMPPDVLASLRQTLDGGSSALRRSPRSPSAPHMDRVAVTPIFNLYDKGWPLRTWQQQYPPAKTVFADPDRMGVALDSIVCAGSIISGGRVKRSILGYDVRVNSFCEVEHSIIFNHVNVGRHSRVRNAIIDRHVVLPEHTEIGYELEADRSRYHVSEKGTVTVVREESMLEEPE